MRLGFLIVYVVMRIRAIVAGLVRRLRRSPYGHEPRSVQVLVGTDGKPIADSAVALAYVSRHGLSGAGVSCPVCGAQAARPNQWRKVRQTKWGEAILCSCGKVLLASPDDDIDPVKPGDKYDEALYHTFHKPAGWRPPMPRIRSKRPELGDWVYIVRGLVTVMTGGERKEGPTQDVAGAEGRITALLDEHTLEVALAGNSGFGGSDLGGTYAKIPVENAFVMIPEAIRPGDLVSVNQGQHKGRTGTLIQSLLRDKLGMQVSLAKSEQAAELTINLPIEHLELLIADEIHTDDLAPGQLPTRK